jgi:pilus assembly protein Flp/PilA
VRAPPFVAEGVTGPHQNVFVEDGGFYSMNDYLIRLAIRLKGLADEQEGQDLVEYALLAGFVAVAAGALLPAISTSISTIFSRMGSVLSTAATS